MLIISFGAKRRSAEKLNVLSFKLMGDMNWQNHCGIMSAPIDLAVKFNIPLIIWGKLIGTYQECIRPMILWNLVHVCDMNMI